jgi:hypothetical protein
MNWKKLNEASERHAALAKEHTAANFAAERTRSAVEISRQEYGRGLQQKIQRLCQSYLDRTKCPSCCINVRVYPLVDHRDYNCTPMATVQWPCKGGRFDFEEVIKDDCDVASLVNRFIDTVKINRERKSPNDQS